MTARGRESTRAVKGRRLAWLATSRRRDREPQRSEGRLTPAAKLCVGPAIDETRISSSRSKLALSSKTRTCRTAARGRGTRIYKRSWIHHG